jgi:hypothetical protein
LEKAMNNEQPWYQRARRWGQTNLTETDPLHDDLDFWRNHWKRTHVQGIIVNAGGIVAYYPTQFELQYRAAHLNDRDLLGDVVSAARQAGLAVLARMDSNRATSQFYKTHPDWFCINREGEPFQSGDRYVACVNGPYYKEYLPEIMREIIDQYHPDGFTDNSWAGAGRSTICYCEACQESFHDAVKRELPKTPDWKDPVYRQWIRWSFTCRLANWELNNRVTKEAGGSHCLWLGMLNANPVGTQGALVDLKSIGERSEIVMCDHQGRDALNGFEQNGLNGKLLHGLLGWEKQIPESMAMYVRGERAFRKASNPPEESRTWMIGGFAGGISPWWHHIGTSHEDRRQFDTAEPAMAFHVENEVYLYDRTPIANVGLVWSQDNTEFYGRDDRRERVALPWRGFTRALTRARIPYLPVHADHIARDAENLNVLILPHLGAMSDAQCDAIRDFVASGGNLIATGQSSRFDEWGEPRDDFGLSDVFGLHATDERHGPLAGSSGNWEGSEAHNYLRLGAAHRTDDVRHPLLSGFEKTEILPFGGTVEAVNPESDLTVVSTYIPAFPIYPPEFSWMRHPKTEIATVLTRPYRTGQRIVYFAADIDRCYARQHLPDHGDLLANAVRWAVHDRLPLTVEGPGYLDCHLFKQAHRLILHIVNLSGCTAWPGYVEEHISVGPIQVAIRLSAETLPASARLCVKGQAIDLVINRGWARFELASIGSHEMVVIE